MHAYRPQRFDLASSVRHGHGARHLLVAHPTALAQSTNRNRNRNRNALHRLLVWADARAQSSAFCFLFPGFLRALLLATAIFSASFLSSIFYLLLLFSSFFPPPRSFCLPLRLVPYLFSAYTPTLLRADSHIGGPDCLHFCVPGLGKWRVGMLCRRNAGPRFFLFCPKPSEGGRPLVIFFA